MKRLFEPLFDAKIKGIGLGLWFQNKAESNGGTIKVKSLEGKGSTFAVILPIYRNSKKWHNGYCESCLRINKQSEYIAMRCFSIS